MIVAVFVIAFLVLQLGVCHSYLRHRRLGARVALRRALVHLAVAWGLGGVMMSALMDIAPDISRWGPTAWGVALVVPAILSWVVAAIAGALTDPRERDTSDADGEVHLRYGADRISRA